MHNMNLRIAYHILADEVMPACVFFMGETFVYFRPAGNAYTYALKTNKQVEVAAGDDKQGFTVSMQSGW